jgi:hypothetical protein
VIMLMFKERLPHWLRSVYSNYQLHADIRTNLNKQHLIIVHQMGKVGSTSIVESLEAMSLGMPIYHTHSLNLEHLQRREQQKRQQGQTPPPRIIQGQYLRKAIDQKGSGKTWHIITLVREPISRNVSAFFQNIGDYIPNFAQARSANQISLDEIVTIFLEQYNHDWPSTWFDSEVKQVFGIDVLATDFPKSKGYMILKQNHINLLVLRLEDLNRCVQDAFQEFLGLESFTLKDANLADHKAYNDLYKQFKAQIVLPDWYLDKLCHSPLMQHFYTPEEIDRFRGTWTKTHSV